MPTEPAPAASPSRPARWLACAAVGLWATLMLALCTLKSRTFLYADFDLAIFSQALSGMLRGQWFSSVRGMAWLGDHSSLVLVPLAPLAAVVRPAVLLPALQVLALALGALPLFAYARRRLGDERAAAAFAAVWVLQPALSHMALFEFHPETLATPALLGAAVALSAGRSRAACAFAALAALCKEDVALPLAVLGAVHAARPAGPSRAAGFALLGIAAGSLALSFGVLKPALAHGEADYGAMYAAWGRTPGAVLARVAHEPLRALAALVQTPGDAEDARAKAWFWAHLLGPVLGVALLAPLTLLPAAPVLAEHLLSSRLEQHTIVYQYTALTLPFVALAAVDGVAVLSRSHPRRALPLALALVAAAALAQGLFGPCSLGLGASPDAPAERSWPDGHDRARAPWRAAFQRRLPARGALVVDFPSLAPLSGRDSLHSLHHVASGRFTYSSRPYPAPARVAGMLGDLGTLVDRGEIDDAGLARLRAFASSRALRVVDAAGDLLLWLPGARDTFSWLRPVPGDAAAPGTRFDGALEFAGGGLAPASVRPGGLLGIETRWRRVAALPCAPMVQWTVFDSRGRARDDEPRRIGYGLADAATWPAGATFAERYRWLAPADLRPGEYTLRLSVWWHREDGDAPAHPDDAAVRASDGMIDVGRFRVTR